MDRWLKTGTMKRKLNENASDTDKEKGHSRRGAAFKQRFFLPLQRQQDDNCILCCVTLDNDNS